MHLARASFALALLSTLALACSGAAEPIEDSPDEGALATGREGERVYVLRGEIFEWVVRLKRQGTRLSGELRAYSPYGSYGTGSAAVPFSGTVRADGAYRLDLKLPNDATDSGVQPATFEGRPSGDDLVGTLAIAGEGTERARLDYAPPGRLEGGLPMVTEGTARVSAGRRCTSIVSEVEVYALSNAAAEKALNIALSAMSARATERCTGRITESSGGPTVVHLGAKVMSVRTSYDLFVGDDPSGPRESDAASFSLADGGQLRLVGDVVRSGARSALRAALLAAVDAIPASSFYVVRGGQSAPSAAVIAEARARVHDAVAALSDAELERRWFFTEKGLRVEPAALDDQMVSGVELSRADLEPLLLATGVARTAWER